MRLEQTLHVLIPACSAAKIRPRALGAAVAEVLRAGHGGLPASRVLEGDELLAEGAVRPRNWALGPHVTERCLQRDPSSRHEPGQDDRCAPAGPDLTHGALTHFEISAEVGIKSESSSE